MRILAFETSAKSVGVALFADGKLLSESYQNTGLTHSQTLMVMAEDLMKQCAIQPADLQAVAVAAGPGSFTGVRIGVAAAKGLAWGLQIPCYGVSTLQSMALGLGVHTGTVCTVMDARRSQVYNALFTAKDGVLQRKTEDRAIALAELAEELKQAPQPIFLVGDGSSLTWQTLHESVEGLVMPMESRMHQRAVGVGLAALQAFANGESGDAAALQPNYLRLSQAEREKLEKQK